MVQVFFSLVVFLKAFHISFGPFGGALLIKEKKSLAQSGSTGENLGNSPPLQVNWEQIFNLPFSKVCENGGLRLREERGEWKVARSLLSCLVKPPRSFLLFGFFILASGCETKEMVEMFKAQNCLDKATPEMVQSCLEPIQGYKSENSWLLRCSGGFIAEGIDEDSMIKALENIDGEGSGDPTTPAIAALAMENRQVSAQVLEVCEQTNSEALTALANFSNMATTMRDLIDFDTDNPDEVQDKIDEYLADPTNNGQPEEKEALGSAIISSQESLCNRETGLFKDNEACTHINQAINQEGVDNPEEVADRLLELLQ